MSPPCLKCSSGFLSNLNQNPHPISSLTTLLAHSSKLGFFVFLKYLGSFCIGTFAPAILLPGAISLYFQISLWIWPLKRYLSENPISIRSHTAFGWGQEVKGGGRSILFLYFTLGFLCLSPAIEFQLNKNRF